MPLTDADRNALCRYAMEIAQGNAEPYRVGVYAISAFPGATRRDLGLFSATDQDIIDWCVSQRRPGWAKLRR